MGKKPKIGKFLDDEEKALVEAIERSEYEIGESDLGPERFDEIRKAAQATINDERTKITLRLSRTDLAKLKAKAMREGLPYQTLIGSILHKAVSS